MPYTFDGKNEAVTNIFRAMNDKIVYIDHYRDLLGETTTLGKLYLDGEYFCETLEDKVRPYGEKIYGETAIPENHKGYNVGVTNSDKFGWVVFIYTDVQDGLFLLKHRGIEFSMIYAHGGNKSKDSYGCVLIALNRIDDNTIQGSQKTQLFTRVKQYLDLGFTVIWRIFNYQKK